MAGRHLRGTWNSKEVRGMGENSVHQMFAFQPPAFSNTLIPFCFSLLPSRQTKPWKPKKFQVTVAPSDESKKSRSKQKLQYDSSWEVPVGNAGRACKLDSRAGVSAWRLPTSSLSLHTSWKTGFFGFLFCFVFSFGSQGWLVITQLFADFSLFYSCFTTKQLLFTT